MIGYMKMRRAIVMFSGGKDSVAALLIALLQGFEVSAIVTFMPLHSHPWYVHKPLVEYTHLQLKLLSIQKKHIMMPLTSKDRELERLEIKKALENLYAKIPFDYIVLGIIASDAQRTAFLDLCNSIGIKLYTPFWGKDPAQHLLDIVNIGIKFVITAVNAWGLPIEFLGRVVDFSLALRIIELSKRYGFNPSFEGGEAESFVIYTPLFKDKKICIDYEIQSISYFEGYLIPKAIYIC